MIHSKCDFNMWEIFIIWKLYFVPLDNRRRWMQQQGDKRTYWKCSAPWEHLTQIWVTHRCRKCFHWALFLLHFGIVLSQFHSGNFFPNPETRANIAINQMKLYMRTLGLDEGRLPREGCRFMSLLQNPAEELKLSRPPRISEEAPAMNHSTIGNLRNLKRDGNEATLN